MLTRVSNLIQVGVLLYRSFPFSQGSQVPVDTFEYAYNCKIKRSFPHVAPPTIHEQFGEDEGPPLFNVAATPANIDAVISSGAWTKSVEVSSKAIFDSYRGIGEVRRGGLMGMI